MSEFKEGDKVRVKADCEKFLDGKMGAEIYVTPRVAGKIGKVKVATASFFTSRAEVQFEDPSISQFIPRAWLELAPADAPAQQFEDGDKVRVITEQAYHTSSLITYNIPPKKGEVGTVIDGCPDGDNDILVAFEGGSYHVTQDCLELVPEDKSEPQFKAGDQVIVTAERAFYLDDTNGDCYLECDTDDEGRHFIPVNRGTRGVVVNGEPDELGDIVVDFAAPLLIGEHRTTREAVSPKCLALLDDWGELKEALDYQQAESDFQRGIEELMKHEDTCTEDIFLKDVRATLFDRGEDYGGIEDNFADIAKGWSAIFNTDVRPDQVALAMIFLKLVRANNGYKRDNAIDIAGYAVHLAAIQERQGR